MTDPSNGRTICTFAGNLLDARFISATKVGYYVQGGQPDTYVYLADLTLGTSSLAAAIPSGLVGSAMAWSPTGKSLTYVDLGAAGGLEWHLVSDGADKLLTSSAPQKAVDTVADQDDVYLSFSADGAYLALLQRTAVDPTGAQYASVEVRAVTGERLFYQNDVTMATWSTRYLYFYDNSFGIVRFWQPGQPQLGGVGISDQWIRPASSPDGRYIVFTSQLQAGTHHAWLYDLQASTTTQIGAGGRFGAIFLSQGLIWYAEETPCQSTCGPGGPQQTGRTFIYFLDSKSEAASVITRVYDIWPHLGAGRQTPS